MLLYPYFLRKETVQSIMSVEEIEDFFTYKLCQPIDTTRIILSYITDIVETFNTVLYHQKHPDHFKKDESRDRVTKVFASSSYVHVHILTKEGQYRLDYYEDNKFIIDVYNNELYMFALVVNPQTNQFDKYYAYNKYTGQCGIFEGVSESDNKYIRTMNEHKQMIAYSWFYGDYFLYYNHRLCVVNMITGHYNRRADIRNPIILCIHKNIIFTAGFEILTLFFVLVL